MKMKMKMTSVAALLLVALMAVGVSYALWSKTLYIWGTVYTGDLNAEFDLTGWTWEALDESGVPIDPIKVQDIIVNVFYGIDNQEIEVGIEELYPCIYIHIYFDLINPGTVPWIVQDFIDTSPVGFPGTVTWSPVDLIGTQLDPGDPPILMDIVVHIDNTALENDIYSFSAEVFVVQWNEYIP